MFSRPITMNLGCVAVVLTCAMAAGEVAANDCHGEHSSTNGTDGPDGAPGAKGAAQGVGCIEV